MNPSIKDVAARAGCSIATVSRVLSGTGYISDEAKDKVMEAVRLCLIGRTAWRAACARRNRK